MKKTIITLSALALMGCANQKTEQQAEEAPETKVETMDIKGTWNIEQAMGLTTENAENTAFINFDENGSMNGNASVNIFNGSYSFDGEKLSLSNIGMTRMMGASMEVEDAITKALNNVASIKGADNKAYVLDANNDTIMVLSKVCAE